MTQSYLHCHGEAEDGCFWRLHGAYDGGLTERGLAEDGPELYFLPMDVESPAGGATYLHHYRETWIASHGSDLGFSSVYLDKARVSAKKDPETVLEVFCGETACGMLELSPHQGADQGAGHIALIYLAADYRGRGLGVQLINQAASYYRAKGRRFLRLRVAASNLPALSFYRRWGFVQADTEQGAFGETYVMTRPL